MTKAEFLSENTSLTVKIIGEIDHHGATLIRQEIDDMIIKTYPKRVTMDFSRVSFMDSSGIGLVLARYKLCSDFGIHLYVSGVDSSTGKILSLAGIKTIKDIQNQKVNL